MVQNAHYKSLAHISYNYHLFIEHLLCARHLTHAASSQTSCDCASPGSVCLWPLLCPGQQELTWRLPLSGSGVLWLPVGFGQWRHQWQVGVQGRRKVEHILPLSLHRASPPISDCISVAPAPAVRVLHVTWCPWLLGNTAPSLCSFNCLLLVVANLWITSGSYPVPPYSNEFVFLKPSQFKIFTLLILPSSQQSANLSFSVTVNMDFYLYHCNQFPALHSFFC